MTLSLFPIKAGDKVSLKKWDRTERPVNRMGECKVTHIEYGQRCESGTMVTVENDHGRTACLDLHWLDPA